MAWTREEGPLTRGKNRQNRPNTRNMRRQAAYTKPKFMCGCCAGSENPENWFKTPRAEDKKKNVCLIEKCRDTNYKNTDDLKKRVLLVPKINRLYNRKGCKAPGGRGRARKGQDSVQRVVTICRLTAPAPGAACARKSKSTSFSKRIRLLPFALANSNRSVKPVAAFDCHKCDRSCSEHTPNRVQQDDKIFSWEDIYPKVRLCDIGPLCIDCRYKCSFALPENVRSKHRFKEEMRAGFRFEPGCWNQKKQSFHEIIELRNNGQLSRSDSETINSQLTNVNEEIQDVANDTEAVACHGLQKLKSGELCTADQGPNYFCMNGMQHKSNDSSRNLLESDPLVHTRTGILSDNSSIQNGHCMGSLLSYNECSDTLGSFHCMDSTKRTEEQPLRPNGLTLGKTDELETFTCQRVRVYSSCARTCLTWPFLKKKNSSTGHTENGVSKAGRHSLFQIGQPFEAADPDQSPQLETSNSNQGVEETLNESLTNFVNASSDLSTDTNEKCLLYSSQQSASSFQKQRKVKKSSYLLFESTRSTPSPSTLGMTENSPNMIAATCTETSGILNNVSSWPSPLTTAVSCVNLTQTAGFVSLDSNESCDSYSLLPQYMETSQNESVKGPPKLEPFYKTSPFIDKLTTLENDSLLSTEICRDTVILLPPLLTPLNSPLKSIMASAPVEYENHNNDMPKPELLTEHPTPEMTLNENSHAQDYSSTQMEAFLNPDVHKCVVRVNEESQQPLITQAKVPSPASDSSTQSSNIKSSGDSSSNSDSDSSQMSEIQQPHDLEPEVFDELKAYEHDILLVDLFQEDTDLFEKLPQKCLLKIGPVRTSDTPKPGCKKMVKIMPHVSESSKITQSLSSVNLDFLCDNLEDSPRRSWRPQCNSSSSALQCDSYKLNKIMGSSEGKLLQTGQERTVHFPMDNISPHISPLLASRLGFTRTTSTPNAADIRWQKPAYCRNYFSESVNCGFKACHFHHVPMDGDEKFCTETVARFAKNQACLHKAGAVFTGFYQSNKPGVYFSMPVLVTLLWALLKAGMLSDLFSVLRTSLAHNIVPKPEFLLELFNFIREKGRVSFVPELMQLTFKMAEAGLSLNLDCLDCVKNSEVHQAVSSNSATALSGNNRSTTPAEYLNLAHAMIEMELCTKQENWKRLGKVFQAICQATQQVSQVERISGHIAVALLSESKDRVTLPFAAFAETAAYDVDDDSPVKSCLGRIGVSLMLRYHKTHQWAKGLKVVEVLYAAKVKYATMKSLFGNEDRTSRCHLINVATELYLLNNSVEGALNSLRENEWFVTSSVWPCDAADIENRTHVSLRLAEMTSHRDTLEILSNLPGLKEPNGHINISRYTTVFTAHLQVCLDRQILPVASDLVDFMLSKGLQVDHAMLQMLLHKLGKQNFWLRAREIFKHSVNKGYYPGVSAPLGLMTLMVPSELGEIELALTFEMFITVNATAILALPENTTSTMSITLKRTQSAESDYLSAGSRLLSAACIPQPKLGVRYMAVSSTQEQVFALDISSARRWLRNNHLWANEVWTVSM